MLVPSDLHSFFLKTGASSLARATAEEATDMLEQPTALPPTKPHNPGNSSLAPSPRACLSAKCLTPCQKMKPSSKAERKQSKRHLSGKSIFRNV